jgi:hypothetical protein
LRTFEIGVMTSPVMLLFGPGDIYDFNLGELSAALGRFDEQLTEIDYAINRAVSLRLGCPEGFGYFDEAEHVCGQGFVACQTYMAETFGHLDVPKAKALAVAPQTTAALISHAANLWKHRGEWRLKNRAPASKRQQEKTIAALATVGVAVETADYPLTDILAALVAPASWALTPLVPKLEAWRDGLLPHSSLRSTWLEWSRRDASAPPVPG